MSSRNFCDNLLGLTWPDSGEFGMIDVLNKPKTRAKQASSDIHMKKAWLIARGCSKMVISKAASRVERQVWEPEGGERIAWPIRMVAQLFSTAS